MYTVGAHAYMSFVPETIDVHKFIYLELSSFGTTERTITLDRLRGEYVT